MTKGTATKSKPQLWSRIVSSVKSGSKGGKPGQWSAQSAARHAEVQGCGWWVQRQQELLELSVQVDSSGLGYKVWKELDAGSKSNRRAIPSPKARDNLSKKEYAATSRKKRADTKKGKQFSSQPKKIANKTKSARS